jgi:hypothetical protein
MDVSILLQGPVVLSPTRAHAFPSISPKTDPCFQYTRVFDGCLLQVLKYVPAVKTGSWSSRLYWT